MNPLSKQAYLIITHKDDLVFQTLLKMLDGYKPYKGKCSLSCGAYLCHMGGG